MKPSPSTRAESKHARSSNWRVPVFGTGIWPKCATTGLDDARAGWQPMVLVDTSVWIEVFRRPARAPLESYLDLEEAVTCLPVIQEVLQGFRDQRAFQTAREAMHALPIVESPLRSVVYERAIDLYRLARRQGLTIRSGVDCLIAACALQHGLPVVHRNRDFSLLARVSPLEAIDIARRPAHFRNPDSR
jgi:predicted nucleic acid-binding protein